jgi:hypothetical protein
MQDGQNVRQPIFFIGMPRSGTTVAFEAFARHPDLAWPSNYTANFPRMPQLNFVRRILDTRRVRMIGHKSQYGRHRLGNRFLPMPNEAYEFWNRYAHPEFARDYMQVPADPPQRARLVRAVRSLVAWQGKGRFAAKLTGPPRIRFLASAFPDAIFDHVVRDGRAVVHSLLRVGFWREKGGFETPFWTGGPGLPEPARAHDPGILAARQWQQVVTAARSESRGLGAGQYVELRYEDFVRDPLQALGGVLRACELSVDPAVQSYVAGSAALSDMNRKYLQDFEPGYVAELEGAMQPALSQFGYS